MEDKFHVTGLGNAIVDVLAHVEEGFLHEQRLEKGAMTLIDAARAETLYGQMPSGVEASGGSCANTMAALANLGGRGCYIGKVRDDQLGTIFAHDITAAGVTFPTRPARAGSSTARCLIMVTPDAQRTMCTYLGACVELTPADLDQIAVRQAQVLYLEGYLWDPPGAREACRTALAVAKEAGRKVALTLSDPFCVERHRQDFRALVDGGVDILFGNQDEICSLYEVDSFDEALQAVRGRCEIVALTRSEKGSVVLSGDEVHVIDAEPVAQVVDTTGAGDLYAAGFLYGLTHGHGLRDCARIGGIAAAEVISHIGARPLTSLSALIEGRVPGPGAA